MKYIELSIDKIVKFDENGFSLPDCPVCDKAEFRVLFVSEGNTELYCKNDEVIFRRDNQGKITVDFAIYAKMNSNYIDDQAKRLRVLFNKGLITYDDLLGYLKFGSGENV
ncbi:hypothetical protein LCGC14_0908160 [marine sediment metagenome]|uniref:Uncharacterized protein n=1 Tax=marine sediment metagenome TaxID=412755 RepID=A0A0F9NZ41_9ZZZZ